MRRVPEATVQSDYDLLLARVASGELGAGNLVEMILNEQSKNAALVSTVKEWQVLYNDVRSVTDAVNDRYYEGYETVADLVELILWLAIPWADNDPLFPESDGWTPRALEANARMKRTWQRVVRNQSPGAVPEENKGGANDPE